MHSANGLSTFSATLVATYYNWSMNDETYTPCTKCGRPMAYCKGQCCGKPKGCQCREYGPSVCGAIRQCEPKCPFTATIPSVVVEHADSLKDLCNTFVHVSDINTTFYIDDKHRPIITWAGPVEYDNYDLALNSLDLRSQFLIDFANSRGAYYNKTGNYQVFNFGNGGGEETARYEITASNLQTTSTFATRNWSRLDNPNRTFYITAYSSSSVTITKDGSSVSTTDLLDAGDSLLEAIFSFDVIAIRSIDGVGPTEFPMHVSATPTSVVSSEDGGLKVSGTYCLDEAQWTEEPASISGPPLRFSLGIGSGNIWFQFETFEDLV